MKSEDIEKYYGLLKMAEARIFLDFSAVDKWSRKTGVDCLPVKSGNSRKYFEYTLNLSIKLKRKEYVDFIRGITPIIVDLFEIVLKKQCRIDINNYVKKTDKGRVWDRNKLYGTEIEKILNRSYKDGFRGGPVYSDHVRILIEKYSKDAKLIKLANELRKVEANIRNMAAHDIVSITDEKIKSLTGFTGKQIMDKIIRLFIYTDIGVTANCWESYDQMNEIIIKAMESHQLIV